MKRLLICFLVAVAAAGCGGDSSDELEAALERIEELEEAQQDAAETPSTQPPTTSPAATSSTTTAPPTTTVPETTTVPPVTVTTTTSLPFDAEPPQAPTGLECLGLGGGSGEVILAFDAPSDPTDIETIRVYVDERSGFQRVAKTTTDGAPASIGSVWDLDTTDPTTWSMGVYPVPNFVEISIAVTFGDAAGNESGWNPITVTPTFDGCS
jgi:hypothetical protein